MAVVVTQMHVGILEASKLHASNGFCSWCFQQKTGKLHVDATLCTCADQNMLNHHAPFPVAPTAPTVALPRLGDPITVPAMPVVPMGMPEGDGREIVC